MSDGAQIINTESKPSRISTGGDKPESKTRKVTQRMFLDDMEYTAYIQSISINVAIYSMIRRLSWSTDGSFLLTPASIYRDLQTD